jgi:hypothetical protein
MNGWLLLAWGAAIGAIVMWRSSRADQGEP